LRSIWQVTLRSSVMGFQSIKSYTHLYLLPLRSTVYAPSLGILKAVVPRVPQVVVQAVDDSTRHTATTEVVVMVTDVNDNAPSFPEFPAVSLREGRLWFTSSGIFFTIVVLVCDLTTCVTVIQYFTSFLSVNANLQISYGGSIHRLRNKTEN